MIYEWFEHIKFKNEWVLPFLLMLPVFAWLSFKLKRSLKSVFKVTSFTFSLLPERGEYWGPFTVKGAELSTKIKDELKAFAGRGGRIFLEDIKAVGPDRRPRSLNTVIITYTN